MANLFTLVYAGPIALLLTISATMFDAGNMSTAVYRSIPLTQLFTYFQYVAASRLATLEYEFKVILHYWQMVLG